MRAAGIVATAIAGLVAVAVLASATPVSAYQTEECRWRNRKWYCDGGGDGGGSGGGPRSYWTEWKYSGACLVDPDTSEYDFGLEYSRHLLDPDTGTVVQLQSVCVRSEDAGDVAWDALTSDARVTAEPEWNASPDNAVAEGVTGLETWMWFAPSAQVEIIDLTWSPAPGLTVELQGRAWVESITWTTGDGGTYSAMAPTYDSAESSYGSESDPAATHVYGATSVQHGFAGGYPVAVSLRWVGEYRLNAPGAGGWSAWVPVPSEFDVVGDDTYTVIEIRSALTG